MGAVESVVSPTIVRRNTWTTGCRATRGRGSGLRDAVLRLKLVGSNGVCDVAGNLLPHHMDRWEPRVIVPQQRAQEGEYMHGRYCFAGSVWLSF